MIESRRVNVPMLRAAAGMLNSCAEHLEPLAVGYGAQQMRSIARELSEPYLWRLHERHMAQWRH